MAVAHDAAIESHTGTTGSNSQDSFSWTHTPAGTPKGVLIFVFNYLSDADLLTSLTYGGIDIPAVTGGLATDTATEAGRCEAFFLGSGVPTGAQTVVVTRVNNSVSMYAVSITVTAAADKDTDVHTAGIILLQNDGAYAQQSVTDGSPGTNSVRYAGAYYGGNAPAPAGANSTLLHSIDIGAGGHSVVRETTAGQGARLVGFTQGTADDRAGVHLAIKEVAGAVAAPGPTFPGMSRAARNLIRR